MPGNSGPWLAITAALCIYIVKASGGPGPGCRFTWQYENHSAVKFLIPHTAKQKKWMRLQSGSEL